MLNIRWKKVLRELWSNKARTSLVVLSIAVGVFAVGTIANSWVVLLNDLNNAYNATNPASAVISLESFDDDLVSAVEGRREVSAAEGRRTIVVKSKTTSGELINLNLTAVDEYRDMTISQVLPDSGAWPPAHRELLLERSWAEPAGYAIGDPITVEMPDGQTYELTLAGYAHDMHVPPAGNSELAYGYVSMDTIEYLGEQRFYNSLYLIVADNPLDEEHISEVVTSVKDLTLERNGYTVFSTFIPTPAESPLAPIFKAILLVLAFLGVFSLLLSGALVINTVSAVITRQIKQIGVMKAIGGRNAQITEIYLSSVAIFGLMSLGVALPLALLGTKGLTAYFAGVGNFDIVTTGIPPAVIGLEFFVGLMVPVVAAMIPITFGTRITVREAISDYGIARANPGGNLIDRITSRIRGLPNTFALSLRNTFRRKGRLFLTLGTLTLAGAIFVAVLSVRISLFATFNQVLGYTQYDLSINLSDAYRINQLEREASRISGVVDVEGWLQKGTARIRPDGTESENYSMIGVPAESTFVEPTVREGRWIQPGDQNKIVVNTDFSRQEPDLGVGDSVKLSIGDDDYTFQIVGIVTTQYEPVIYIDYTDLARTVNEIGLADRAVLKLSGSDPEFQTQVAEGLEERFKKAGLLVGSTTTRSEFVETFEGRFNVLTVFLLAMAFLLAFVGGMGLAGTMGLNVLERVREIGVMRAIGASNWAVQRIILSEGIVIGLMSWILATILALPLSIALSNGVGIAFGGEPLEFNFSVLGTFLWLALAVLIGSISSYLPARRASRLSVREVLDYE